MLKRLKRGNSVLKIVDERNFEYRLIIFIIACFGVALNYNLFFVPNNLVVGGMSGLAIVIKELTGLPTTVFLYGSMVVLTIVAYIFLGKGKALNTIIGSLIFALMVSVTEPMAQEININLNSEFLILLLSSTVYGACSGLIYRAGFNMGGSDVISAIINQYLKVPMGISCTIVNLTIIFFGSITFGPTHTIYAICILIVANKLIDVVMLGINDSKLCFVKAKNNDKIKKYLMNNLKLGVTEITSSGGIFTAKNTTLLVIVPFNMYYGFKHVVLDQDPGAFILTHDCYAVSGGYKKHIIPF